MLQKGTIQKDISTVLQERQKNLAVRKDRAVGTNMYANMGESNTTKIRSSFSEIKAERLKNMDDCLSDVDDVKDF